MVVVVVDNVLPYPPVEDGNVGYALQNVVFAISLEKGMERYRGAGDGGGDKIVENVPGRAAEEAFD